jgi:hypothetical protein
VNITRAFPVFGAVFGFFYALNFHYAYALFTYHPLINDFSWGYVAATDDAGPSMFWYGWIALAALCSAGVALLSLLVPRSIADRVWPGFAWLLPVLAMALMAWFDRVWFLPVP